VVLSEADERGQRRLFSWGCGLFGQTGVHIHQFIFIFFTLIIKFIFLFRQFHSTHMTVTFFPLPIQLIFSDINLFRQTFLPIQLIFSDTSTPRT